MWGGEKFTCFKMIFPTGYFKMIHAIHFASLFSWIKDIFPTFSWFFIEILSAKTRTFARLRGIAIYGRMATRFAFLCFFGRKESSPCFLRCQVNLLNFWVTPKLRRRCQVALQNLCFFLWWFVSFFWLGEKKITWRRCGWFGESSWNFAVTSIGFSNGDLWGWKKKRQELVSNKSKERQIYTFGGPPKNVINWPGDSSRDLIPDSWRSPTTFEMVT